MLRSTGRLLAAASSSSAAPRNAAGAAAAGSKPLRPKRKDNTFQMVTLFLVAGGALWYWRKNQKVDLFEADFEKSATGRHRVDMASRLDQEKLQKWLAAEEAKEAAARAAGGQTAAGSSDASSKH